MLGMRQTRWVMLGALAVLAMTVPLVSAQCPENPDDCQFQYTNIRLESSTPTVHGVYNPGTPPPTASPPPGSDLLQPGILQTGAVEEATAETANPFSNVDLSSFSDEDLEVRRELLLAILEQTNAELGVPPPAKGVRSAPSVPVQALYGEVELDGEGADGVVEGGDVKAMDQVIETEDEVVETEDEVVETEDIVVETEDEVVETEDIVVETEQKDEPQDIAAVTEEVSTSFFKKLIGGSSSPSSSASTSTLSAFAGILALLLSL